MLEEQTLYPKKPANAADFKKAVAWFGGRELIASLKGTIMYGIYGENIDPRSWMKANEYPNIEKTFLEQEIEKEVVKTETPETADELQARSENETISLTAEEEKLYSVRKTEATEKIKDDPDIQTRIARKVEREWANRISDHWKWKQTHYAKWDEFSTDAGFWKRLQNEDQKVEEVWFDFIADSGDGQMGVYNVACLCLSDLWINEPEQKNNDNEITVKLEPPKDVADLKNHKLLPRGAFLFVGGDTAYHTSNYQTLYERFQLPFRWAFTSVRQFMAEEYQLRKSEILSAGENAEAENIKTLQNTAKELEGTIPAFLNGKLYSDTEPPRPIFGIPANHDYYDAIDGFNRLFRRPPFDNIEENMSSESENGKPLLQIPTFSREQEASYIAIRLPFDWWMFGIDSENEKLDFRQKLFFQQIVEKKPEKLILATPEPTTVFGKKSGEEEKTAVYLKAITSALGLSQPFLTDGKLKPVSQTDADKQPVADLNKKYCRLDLSGDVHHYARYWGENTKKFNTDKFSAGNYASVVAGGGGAFFDVTRTLIGKPEDENGKLLTDDRKIRGEIPPQNIFPSEKESVDKTADRIFDLWNLRNGGYVQIAGAVIGIIVFYFLQYYSNISHLQWITDDFTTKFFKPNNIKYSCAVLFLLVVAAIVFFSARQLNKLIKTLKEKSLKRQLDKDIDGRVIQAAKKSLIPLGFAAALYIVFLLFAYSAEPIVFITETGRFESYLLSLILLLHLVIALLMFWLSAEYTNWLAVRFKIMRGFKRKTRTQRLEDPHDESNNWFEKQLGKVLRNYSYQYFPANVVTALAIGVLIIGINLFGRMQLAAMLADLLLTLTVAGIFFLVYYFAIGVGAAYHKTGLNKHYFKLLGIWHAILQVASTYILFVYGSWKIVLLVFLLVLIFNGSAILSYLIKKLFGGENKESLGNRIANFRLAAVLTKWIDSRGLFLVWIIIGLPFIFLYFFSDISKGFYQNIQNFVADSLSKFDIYISFQKLFESNFSTAAADFNKYVIIVISVSAVGYIGYVLSRVWLSWYLAVAMFFDGHNNEIGGAARIEGFKHILRIKVEEEKLTVYVIGFDEAEPEMKDLKLKLVDKFELKCQPIQKTATI